MWEREQIVGDMLLRCGVLSSRLRQVSTEETSRDDNEDDKDEGGVGHDVGGHDDDSFYMFLMKLWITLHKFMLWHVIFGLYCATLEVHVI